MESILKQILADKGCSFDKYLSRQQFNNSIDDSVIDFYITPVSTVNSVKVLIVSKIVEGNWYETVKNLNGIVEYLEKQFNFTSKEYRLILHAFFQSIDFEQFYYINHGSDSYLEKMKITDLENILGG